MNLADVVGNRWAWPTGGKGPLLIPSYSSKGFPHLRTVFNLTKEYCSRLMLISAYDLYYGAIPAEATQAADVVFIDSGGYENSRNMLFEPFGSHEPRFWNKARYESILRSIRSSNQIVAVTYDPKTTIQLTKQIDKANRFAACFPGFMIDILVKPDNSVEYLNTDHIVEKIRELAEFDCIGFTEKELGRSLLEKCKAVLAIRSALNAIGVSTPIHIFGCLDQETVLSLFLCGADIFDGLTWLKYSMNGDGAFYFNSVCSEPENISRPSEDCMTLMMAMNLEYLRSLQKAMQELVRTQSIDGLPICHKMKVKIRNVLQNVGLSIS